MFIYRLVKTPSLEYSINGRYYNYSVSWENMTLEVT